MSAPEARDFLLAKALMASTVPAEFPLVPAPDVLAAALRYDKGTPNEGRIRAKMPSECRMADALRELREECAAVAQEFCA